MKETLNTSTEDSVIKNSMASEEAREYFKLATPMLLTQLAAHATGIISALMTGNYNTVDQAAVAIGNMLFWPAYFGIAGVLFIVTSFVAQFYENKAVPRLVILSEDIKERKLIEKTLSKKENKQISISTAKKGSRLKVCLLYTSPSPRD